MPTVYKLTTSDNKTRKGRTNECTWGPGITHSGTGEGGLCGPGFIHAYLSPELAVLLNPVHADIENPKLWECYVERIDKSDKNLKVGAVSLTTIREIPLPVFTPRQRVVFAVLCAKAALTGLKHPTTSFTENINTFSNWAEKYLSDSADSAAYAAYAAADAAADAAYAAAYAAARTAARTARAAIVTGKQC